MCRQTLRSGDGAGSGYEFLMETPWHAVSRFIEENSFGTQSDEADTSDAVYSSWRSNTQILLGLMCAM